VIAYIGRRLLVSIPVVILATIIVFVLVTARGDPLRDYRHKPGVSQQTVENLEHEYHLDVSKPEQYLLWLGDFVQGDWGRSFKTDQPVTEMVGDAVWNSVLLVVPAVVLSAGLALVVGTVSAVRRSSAFDHVATGVSYFGFSMPDFFFALLLQLVLVVVLQERLGIHLFYVQGKYSPGHEGDVGNLVQHMVLPVLALMLASYAAWSRYQRDSTIDVLHADYIRTARAKGVRHVVRRHALRNASIPFVTVVAIDTGVLLGGVVVIEKIFAWPGMGLLFFRALERSDYPVVLAWMAVATVFVVVANLVADIAYGALDPRIRVATSSSSSASSSSASASSSDGVVGDPVSSFGNPTGTPANAATNTPTSPPEGRAQ
jgi:peptide/nickel transport system permease protein